MERVIQETEDFVHLENHGLQYIQFQNLKKYDGILAHCFTTRIGGVSSGECKSLNLGFNRNDREENVRENFARICDALAIDIRNLVFSNQVHDNKIKAVDEKDRGKGIYKRSDILGYDGLVTDRRGVALVTFYADCVPVLLFDSEKRVIGMAHSGWRGTVKEIAGEAVKKMVEEYGCKPERLEAAIGPCIGKCCFEVGNEVYREFLDRLEWSRDFCETAGGEKKRIDLQGIVKKTLLHFGVPEDRICISSLCTRCNRETFFSHRGDCGKTGSLAAIMQIR